MQDRADVVTIDAFGSLPKDPAHVRRIQLGMAVTGKEDYGTPGWLFDQLNRQFNFSIDLAANEANHKHPRWLGPGSPIAEDSFKYPWQGRCFLNPPFSRRTKQWVRRAIEATTVGDAELVLMVLPVSYVNWFWDYVAYHCRSTILDKRIKFDGAPHVANFDVRLALFSEAEQWRNTYPCVGVPVSYGGRRG